jgi:hypothetical protein
MSLFRLTEYDQVAPPDSDASASEGTCGIRIDGRWIHEVPLAELRASLGVIPQDPTLFRCVHWHAGVVVELLLVLLLVLVLLVILAAHALRCGTPVVCVVYPSGSLRDNLDPFKSHTDEELNAAIQAVELTAFVAERGGLNGQLTSNGGNASVGQRQLLCLARAILRGSTIFVMYVPWCRIFLLLLYDNFFAHSASPLACSTAAVPVLRAGTSPLPMWTWRPTPKSSALFEQRSRTPP